QFQPRYVPATRVRSVSGIEFTHRCTPVRTRAVATIVARVRANATRPSSPAGRGDAMDGTRFRFDVGQRIFHPQFGPGQILSITLRPGTKTGDTAWIKWDGHPVERAVSGRT